MSRARSRKNFGSTSLGSVLRGLSELKVPVDIDASPIAYRDWEAAVGSRIAARARPFKLDRGVLHVRTATSTWAQELSLLSDAIVTQLRGRGIALTGLRFHVGVVDAPPRPPTRGEVRRAPVDAPLSPALTSELARVPDDELREAIARAASKNLGWQAENEREAKRAPARSRSGTSESAKASRRGEPESAPPDRPAPARSTRRERP